MNDQIARILVEELNYSQKSADITSRDLLAIQDAEIRQALMHWLAYRKVTSVKAEGFDAVELTTRMTYPSALLAIDMLRKEPATAKKLLKGFR